MQALSQCEDQGMCVPLDTGSLEEGRQKIVTQSCQIHCFLVINIYYKELKHHCHNPPVKTYMSPSRPIYPRSFPKLFLWSRESDRVSHIRDLGIYTLKMMNASKCSLPAVVFRVLVLPPPHKCLLNQAPHSFLPLGQSQQTL